MADLLRAGLSNQLVDLLTFTLLASECDMPAAEGSVKKAHLLNIQRWIEAHILDAELSLEKVASANGMLLSNLHVLFAGCEMLVSEWIWDRRLQLAYDSLARGGGRSFSSMAFDHGFSSSAHFSTIFERKYGCRLEMLPVAYCSPV